MSTARRLQSVAPGVLWRLLSKRRPDSVKRKKLEKRMEGTMWTGFQKPKRLSYESETMTERYGKFFAQPFERGFGTTIGNSLRRAL